MVSLTRHSRKKSDDTLHLRVPDMSSLERLRPGEPFALWKVGDLPLLYHWLDYAVNEGFTRVLVYCSDRSIAIRKAMEHATLWPIEWDLIQDSGDVDHPGCEQVDTLPGLPSPVGLSDEWRLMDHWFSLEKTWLEKRSGEDSELSLFKDGIGRWCQIHPSAVIHEPVWIGDHVRIGPDSEIGPYVTIGNGCVLSGQNRLAHSKVAEQTFMGRHTELDQCYLEGGHLLNCKYRGAVEQVEPFIAGDLAVRPRRPSRRERFLALRLWLKIVRCYGLRVIRNTPVVELESFQGDILKTLDSEEFLVQRAPLILRAARGKMFLFGVLPRTAAQLELLSPRDRKAIARAPVGAISLADAHGVHSAEDPREVDLAIEQTLSQAGQVRADCREYCRKQFVRAKKDQIA